MCLLWSNKVGPDDATLEHSNESYILLFIYLVSESDISYYLLTFEAGNFGSFTVSIVVRVTSFESVYEAPFTRGVKFTPLEKSFGVIFTPNLSGYYKNNKMHTSIHTEQLFHVAWKSLLMPTVRLLNTESEISRRSLACDGVL